MREAVKLAWVGPSEKTSEPHRQSPHRYKAGRGLLQSADVGVTAASSNDRPLHEDYVVDNILLCFTVVIVIF